MLFGFFVNRMFVAMGAELLEFHPSRGVAAVFLGRVSGHAVRPLVRVGATLGAFEGHNNANALSHSCTRLVILAVKSMKSEFLRNSDTINYCFTFRLIRATHFLTLRSRE